MPIRHSFTYFYTVGTIIIEKITERTGFKVYKLRIIRDEKYLSIDLSSQEYDRLIESLQKVKNMNGDVVSVVTNKGE